MRRRPALTTVRSSDRSARGQGALAALGIDGYRSQSVRFADRSRDSSQLYVPRIGHLRLVKIIVDGLADRWPAMGGG
jgi:hypothetical protein